MKRAFAIGVKNLQKQKGSLRPGKEECPGNVQLGPLNCIRKWRRDWHCGPTPTLERMAALRQITVHGDKGRGSMNGRAMGHYLDGSRCPDQ